MIALRRPAAQTPDPFSFFAEPAVGTRQTGVSSVEDLFRRNLTPEPSPAARLSEMLRQGYAPPEPTVPDYPPVRGFGYKIPIIAPRERPVSSIGRGPAAIPSIPGATRQDFPVQPFVPVLKVEDARSFSPERITGAAGRAVSALFETPLGISDETMGPLINQGSEDYKGVRGVTSLVRTFNEVLIQGGSQGLDAAQRAALAPIVGGIAAVRQTAEELGLSVTWARRLERDLYDLTVVLGISVGKFYGGAPRAPSPYRVITEATARGKLDAAVSQLPLAVRARAKKARRQAFDAGEKFANEFSDQAAESAVLGIRKTADGVTRLTEAGGAFFERVARRLGKKPERSVFEKLAREGIPVAENIAEGKAAIDKAIENRTAVQAGMYRRDVGEITMDFGSPGELKAGMQRGGYGLSHIIARRNAQGQDGERFVREVVPEVLAKGALHRFYTSNLGDRRADIVHKGNLVVLSLFRKGNRETWVLTGFRSRRFTK